MNRFLGFLCFLWIAGATAQVNFATLQLVQVLYRHGERVPEYRYPTDPNIAEPKEGWAQMTEIGKKQEYMLGQFLRSRYQNFVSQNFVPNEVYVTSSDSDRTIMSAQLCLAGMFPTENGTEWNPDLKWQPIPLHTVAEEYDNILRCKRHCPRYEKELKDALYSTEMSKTNSDNAELFQYLSTNSGVNITNIDDIDRFYATMMVEELLGMQVPEWALPIIHTDNFQYMYNLSMAIKSSTPELKRLRTGPLLNLINSRFQERIKNATSKTKLYMYSAHDTTLVNVLNTLDILDLQRPPYASIILMELHKNPETNDYFVNFLYRNDTERDPYPRTLPVCGFDCPYPEFSKFVEPMIPDNWDEECERESAPSGSRVNPIVNYFIAVGVGLILLGVLYFLVSKVLCRNKGKNEGYERF